MAAAQNTELVDLRSFLANKTDAAVLRHCLGVEAIPDAPALLDNAIINCIDCESYEYDHSKLTEIGLAAFDSRDMRGTTPGDYAENLLKKMYFYHHRLIPNAHLINTRFVPGDPTKNRFGYTRFLTIEQARTAITDSFNWLIDPRRPELGMCPVIFVGHAVTNDIIMLSDALGIDAALMGTVVKTIDTQALAMSAGLERPRRQIGLHTLCSIHGFEFRDSHTAGNDAAYTLFNAVFMALRPEYFSGAESDASSKTTQQVVDDVELHSRAHEYDSNGVRIYCERCARYNHLRVDCRAKVTCQNCKNAGRYRHSRSHMTQNCTWN